MSILVPPLTIRSARVLRLDSHVLDCRLREMLINVMEGMLRDVANSQSRMFGDRALLWHRLTRKKLDES